MLPEINPTAGSITVQYSYGDKISPFRFSNVDIIIPFHGQYTKVRNLVESILLHTTSNQYLITLVDDGSPNNAFITNIQGAAPILCYRTEEQRGFAAAVNYAYERTVHDWVCILHSDCFIQQRMWLQWLGECMLKLKSENVKLVHARTNMPTVENPYLPGSHMESRCNDRIVEEDEPLPLVCVMFHRELFKRIGGPLKPYPFAGYENVELFYRMKKYGFKQAVSGWSWVKHEGGATIKHLPEKAHKIMENNYDLCMKDLRI